MFSKLFSGGSATAVEWNNLTEPSQLDEIDSLSQTKPVLIFKHSTRCSISAMVLKRFERQFEEGDFVPYFLDLMAHRIVSNTVAEKYSVTHESPQVLLIKNGKAIHDASHNGIDFEQIREESIKAV